MPIDSVMPSNHLVLCHPFLLLPQSFPASGSFLMSRLFTSGGQSIGASDSVLPMNIQDWFSFGLTGCSPRGSQESSPTPKFKSINSSVISFPYGPTLTSIDDAIDRKLWTGFYFKYCSLLPSVSSSITMTSAFQDNLRVMPSLGSEAINLVSSLESINLGYRVLSS